ncbi:MAG: C39 family peptidase [Myxococcaceae bacterium]
MTPLPGGRVDGVLWRVTARERGLDGFKLNATELRPNGEIALAATGALTANDPPGAFVGGNYHNGGSYRYGITTSPVKVVPGGFDNAVPHFEVDTPPGTWVTVKLSARVNGAWTKDYVMGVWAADEGTVRRHSVDGQGDTNGTVATDTLELTAQADALRLTAVLLSSGTAVPTLRAAGVAAKHKAVDGVAPDANPALWNVELPVPQNSQMLYPGGDVWCSPTSVTMLLRYWSAKLNVPNWGEPIPTAAARTHDWIYGGTGNWTFNMAYAASRSGGRLSAFATRLSSVSQLEPLIKAGVPVAISIRYGGTVAPPVGAPVTSVAGHLLVVRGIDAAGNVIVNDPAFGSDAAVRVVYSRADVQRIWQVSDGLTYVVHPAELTLPADPLGAY